MPDAWRFLVCAALIGAGATAVLDLWSFARKRLQRIPPPDYGLVGRWIGYMAKGRFSTEPIAVEPPLRSEKLIGWTTHYLIGVAYAGVLLAIWGMDWARQPTLGPALLVGVGSVAAPFLVMQPGMGLGIAASRTPHPTVARVRSLLAHTVFGVGLFASAWAVRPLLFPG